MAALNVYAGDQTPLLKTSYDIQVTCLFGAKLTTNWLGRIYGSTSRIGRVTCLTSG